MSFTKLFPQPEPRAASLEFDDIGPGLYPGETALRLDTGHLVAVSIESTWVEGHGGVNFRAWARWIKGTGETRLGPEKQHIEINFPHRVNAAIVNELGVDAISRELLLLVLGEPLTEVDLVVGEDEPPARGLLIPWSEDLRQNASIRNQIAVAGKTTLNGDPSVLLDLGGE